MYIADVIAQAPESPYASVLIMETSFIMLCHKEAWKKAIVKEQQAAHTKLP